MTMRFLDGTRKREVNGRNRRRSLGVLALPVVFDLMTFVQKDHVPFDGHEGIQLGWNVAVGGKTQPAFVIEHLPMWSQGHAPARH